MNVEILQDREKIKEARAFLNRSGIGCLTPCYLRIAYKLGFLKGIPIGDRMKSWDILRAVQMIKDKCSHDDAVLDIGAFGSEMLPSLHKMGFTNLYGVDLNPEIDLMPYRDKIQYHTANFMHTQFNDGMFAAITAISVLEHGFDANGVLGEISRLLRPGGAFIASVDYWPEKIDTSSMQIFGLPWIIFSRKELLEFFDIAADYGLILEGKYYLTAKKPLIRWQGKRYTFAWFVLRKS